ncbi:MAG TPA: patatin-like phospholipase family protein [Candidatus Polarisedimenticolia bacterium]|nr:patatin-like phospholipase family protein [Candidatus Polarisedimenticolia bacterium]
MPDSMIARDDGGGQLAADRAPARLAAVLGAGGIRGLAHAGVLSRLAELGVAPDAYIGVSCGALVASCAAALGWDGPRLAGAAARFGPLAALGPAARRPWLAGILARMGRGQAGEVERLLAELSGAGFDDLAAGVRWLGILCWDRGAGRERFFVTGRPVGRPPLAAAVAGSMSLPLLFPEVAARAGDQVLRLMDGGISRTLPVELAFAAPVAARRVVAVDLGVMTGRSERRLDRFGELERRRGACLRVVRPDLRRFGIVVMRRGDAALMVEAGRRAVTAELAAWCAGG